MPVDASGPGTSTPPGARTQARVLVVDDDRVDRLAVQRALRTLDVPLEITEATSCAEALRLLGREDFDCVLLDYLLPDGSGLDVLHDVKAAGIRTPILILTGQGDEAIAVELMKAGASDYLPKSHATPERLAQCLWNTLRLARAERQVAQVEQERERLLVLEQEAREEAEAARRRLAFLAEASGLVAASLEYATTLENVARLAVPVLADWCFVDLVDGDDASFRRVATAHADESGTVLAKRMQRRYAGFAQAPHGISRVIHTGRSEVMARVPDWFLLSIARDADHLAHLQAIGARAYMCVPLQARGRTLGAMTFLLCGGERTYTLADLSFAEELARRAALAVDNARLYQEAREAQEGLRHQLDFTTAITESLAEGVCAFDLDMRFTFVNPAAESMLGHPAPSLIGRLAREALQEGPTIPRGETPLGRSPHDRRILRSDDATFYRDNGSELLVSYVSSPIVSGGRVVGSVLSLHDVTERKRAEAELDASRRELAQSEKLSALGTLISGVAHELRTPLTYLSNNLFLLQARLSDEIARRPELAEAGASLTRFSEAAIEGVDRINALVKDLRPFTQQESGRRNAASLDRVVAGAVELFRATSRGHVEVEADLQATPPLALDQGQIQRVIINLLVNAAEAMPRGGVVRVRTWAADDQAIVEVEDQGDGIPPGVEARIFDPFFTTKADGTGLGLAITRRIVESHGGAIRYTTRRGVGTTFTIDLPLAPALAAEGLKAIAVAGKETASSQAPPAHLAGYHPLR